MYYSKNGSGTLNVPRNYSGNTFRVIDETERARKPIKEQPLELLDSNNENFITPPDDFSKISSPISDNSEQKPTEKPAIFSFFQGISVDDLLILGLIFVIHQDNPNDPILLLLLILLLTK